MCPLCVAAGAAVFAAGGIAAAKKRSRSGEAEELVDRPADPIGGVDVREVPGVREGDEPRAGDGPGDVRR